MIEAFRDEARALFGVELPGCPWQAFEHPLVADVLDAHAFMESGQLREAWGDDPPAHLVAALRAHHRALNVVHTADLERRRQRHGKPRPRGRDDP